MPSTRRIPSWLLIVATARPQGPAVSLRRGGVDIVVLQDGSASMRVQDVEGDRWRLRNVPPPVTGPVS